MAEGRRNSEQIVDIDPLRGMETLAVRHDRGLGIGKGAKRQGNGQVI